MGDPALLRASLTTKKNGRCFYGAKTASGKELSSYPIELRSFGSGSAQKLQMTVRVGSASTFVLAPTSYGNQGVVGSVRRAQVSSPVITGWTGGGPTDAVERLAYVYHASLDAELLP